MLNRISIDGHFASLNESSDGMDWFIPDPEVDNTVRALNNPERYTQPATLLLGRKTFELFERSWVPYLDDPDAPEMMKTVAQQLTDMDKIVFSTSLNYTDWANTKFYDGDLISVTTELKQKEEENYIMIMGSGSIVRQLADNGLIDSYVLILTPVISGHGKPLFSDGKKSELDLTYVKQFDSGNVVLKYDLPTNNE